MSRPVAGQKYTVVKGDTLWDIATIVYGSGPKYTVIWDANKSHLRSDDPHWIYPGEVLWIPLDPDELAVPEGTGVSDKLQKSTTKDRDSEGFDDFKVTIDGVNIPFNKGSLTVSYNTPADGFAITVDYLGVHKTVYDKLRLPFATKSAEVTIGYKKMSGFYIYNTSVSFTNSTGSATLEGFSKTVDLLDCNPDTGITEHNIKLSDWIKKITKPYGVGLEYKAVADPLIKKVRLDKTATIYSSIEELADKYGVFVSSDHRGRLVIQDLPDPNQVPVGRFDDEAHTPLAQGSVNFNGRSHFSDIIVYGNVRRQHVEETLSHADVLGHYRLKAVMANTITDSELDEAVDKAFYDAALKAFNFTLRVAGWRDNIGNMWEPGGLITLSGQRFLLDNTTVTLYIKTVKYQISQASRTTELTVAPLMVKKDGAKVFDAWVEGRG